MISTRKSYSSKLSSRSLMAGTIVPMPDPVKVMRGGMAGVDGRARRARLLAGVLSTFLGASGFVEALIWIARQGGVSGGAYVAAAFVVCCLVATSTGTSFGTIIIGGPLLDPAGAATGADPAMPIGAILGGATFGDSISVCTWPFLLPYFLPTILSSNATATGVGRSEGPREAAARVL